MADAPQKVLFVTASMSGGGAERVFATLLTHLNRNRFAPHLALIRKTGGYLADIPPDVPVYEVGGGRLFTAPAPLRRLITRLRPGVVVSSLQHVNIISGLVLRTIGGRTRLVLREAGLPSHNLKRLDLPWLMSRLYRPAYRRADAVICQSAAMRDDLLSWGLPPDRLHILNNPLDTEAVLQRAAAMPMKFEQGKRHLVSAGRFSWEKGFDLLIMAFAASETGRDKAILHLLGSGEEEDALRDLAGRLGVGEQVRFHGFVDNPYPAMAAADLYMLPSRYESFSNAALESMALGTPVIGFDCPGGTGELIHTGVNGWLVPPEDVRTMAQRLDDALSAPLLAPEQVAASVAQFDVPVTVPAYERLIAGDPL